MTAGITVTPLAGFEVSQSPGSGYGSSTTVGSSGTIASTTVYVRLAATATVGSYSGNITCASSGATTQNVATVSSTVSKATPIVVVAPYTVTYDGNLHTATVTSITGVNGETGATVGTVTLTNTSHTNAGTYASDSWTFTGTTNYNNIGATTITDTINQTALSITAPTIAAKNYNGTATAGAVTAGTLSGFVGSETVTATGVAANYPSANVGSYSGTVVTYTLANGTNGGLAANYSLANGTATGVINQTALSITAPTIAARDYNGTATAGAVTVGTLSGFVGSETVTATGVAADYLSVNAGSYSGTVVTYTLADGTNGGLAANYSLATGTATGVINKVTPTATLAVSNSPVTYDGTPKSATVGVTTSSVPGSAQNILTGGASTQTAAGTYAVTADFVPTDTTNYNTLTSLAAGNFVIINPYNAWAASKGLTGGNAAQTADPDGDGRINLLEFATNDDPNSGNASGKQKAAVGTVSTQQVFTLTVPVRTGATFSGTNDQVSAAIDGVIYTIQGTTDLVAGFTNTVVPVSEVTGGDATAIQTGMPALESGWTYRTFRATGYTVSGSPFVFLRLKVTASP